MEKVFIDRGFSISNCFAAREGYPEHIPFSGRKSRKLNNNFGKGNNVEVKKGENKVG